MNCGIHASGTFNGNPVGTAAALATIKELEKQGTYEHLDEMGSILVEGFNSLSKKYNIKIYTRHIGGIFILYFGFDKDQRDFREWLSNVDVELYEKFIKSCEAYGIRFTDRRGREYISTTHTKEDIIRTLVVADRVLSEIP